MKLNSLISLGVMLFWLILSANAEQPLDDLRARADAIIKRHEEQIRHNAVKLTGKDQIAAKEALCYFTEIKEPKMIALALEYPSSLVQTEAALCLQEVGNKEIVPEMLAALKATNRVFRGGSEVKVLNRDLKKNLLLGLAEITHLDFSEVDIDSIESINSVIQTVEKWLIIR